MLNRVRVRFWWEAGIASLTAVMGAITLIWPEWIEAVFKVDPDQHSGSLEIAIVIGLLIATLVSAATARAEWCRAPQSAR